MSFVGGGGLDSHGGEGGDSRRKKLDRVFSNDYDMMIKQLVILEGYSNRLQFNLQFEQPWKKFNRMLYM